MRFSTTLAFAAAVLAPMGVRAGITAFSGNTCNGAVGNNVPCDGSCHQFDGRHSFRVDGGSGNHCVTMFVQGGCPAGDRSGQFTFTGQNGQCTNVNTGTGIASFLCSPSNICEV